MFGDQSGFGESEHGLQCQHAVNYGVHRYSETELKAPGGDEAATHVAHFAFINNGQRVKLLGRACIQALCVIQRLDERVGRNVTSGCYTKQYA